GIEVFERRSLRLSRARGVSEGFVRRVLQPFTQRDQRRARRERRAGGQARRPATVEEDDAIAGAFDPRRGLDRDRPLFAETKCSRLEPTQARVLPRFVALRRETRAQEPLERAAALLE